jgi:hypothetical protein
MYVADEICPRGNPLFLRVDEEIASGMPEIGLHFGQGEGCPLVVQGPRPVFPQESQLVLALKTLCGFSTAEIALRLFTSEASIHKRLGSARVRLRESAPDMAHHRSTNSGSGCPACTLVLYLLFNEGYPSAHAEQAIRRELCDEAVRLTTLLAEHPLGSTRTPATGPDLRPDECCARTTEPSSDR